jgi:hypothetical protein
MDSRWLEIGRRMNGGKEEMRKRRKKTAIYKRWCRRTEQ